MCYLSIICCYPIRGGSHTEVVIINENGDQIAAVEGGGSNPWVSD